jgi:uncharacterized protein YeaO (DUF488 family)
MARSRRPRTAGGAGKAGARAHASARAAEREPAPGEPRPSDRIATKRVYTPGAAADGTRVLIMRYWPRGIRRERIDVWLRELAPEIPLLRSFLDGKITWAQYRPRYLAGLRRPQARQAVAEVRQLARQGPVTLLCGCADPRRCHRTLLQAHLLDSAATEPEP